MLKITLVKQKLNLSKNALNKFKFFEQYVILSTNYIIYILIIKVNYNSKLNIIVNFIITLDIYIYIYIHKREYSSSAIFSKLEF